MSQHRGKPAQGYHTDERLLMALAEYLKLPLLQIARRAELAAMGDETPGHLASISLTAETALRLLDNYLLSSRLARAAELQLEPVSVTNILTETAHELAKFSSEFDCQIQVHTTGRYEPVLAHQAGLRAALSSLGYVFLEAQSAQAQLGGKSNVLVLGAHRGKTGIVAGMFADIDGLSASMYQRAHQLYGQTRLSMTELTIDSGAGVFVADALLHTMSARLRVARHHTMSGLAATLAPSRQLQFV